MAKKTIQLWVGVAAIAGVLAAGSAVAAIPRSPVPPGGSVPAVAIPLRANLSASQVPSIQVASTATGGFLGALVRGGFSGRREERPNFSWGLFWVISVKNTTGPITGVEIRSGEVSSATASSAFLKLCGPCNVASAAGAGIAGTTLVGGKLPNLTQAQVTALRTADLYVNVATAANPAGELRGPITRISPVTSGAPPNHRQPNPIIPGPPQTIPGPPQKIPG